MKKIKLNKILKALSPDETSVYFAEFDRKVQELKEQLREKINIKTLDDVSSELDKFKKKLNMQPLIDSMEKLRESFNQKSEELFDEIEKKSAELSRADKERVDNLRFEIEDLKYQLQTLEETRKKDLENIFDSMPNLSNLENIVNEMVLELSSRIDELENVEPIEIENWSDKIEELRKEFMFHISQIGGGSMNRNIAIGGNTSVLSRYTDINLKAGSNVTITYTNNDNTKFTDITIAATGGGGGTVRSINTISTSQTLGDTTGTDFVYICSAGIQATLPTAVSNTNLYTIKNTSNSSVLVATTGGETIDDDVNIIMPIKYTSVDLISDGSNWKIT